MRNDSLHPVRRLVHGLAAVLAALLLITMSPVAHADELDDQRDKVGKEIDELGSQRKALRDQLSRQNKAVDDAGLVNESAANALREAEANLAAAESELAAAEAELAVAEALDQQRAAELAAAELELKKARARVASAQAAYNALQRRINVEISTITQQNGPLVSLALFLTDASAKQVHQQVQMGTTMFDLSALELDEAEKLRFELEAAEQAAKEAEEAAAAAKEAAEIALAHSQELRRQAAEMRNQVASLVQSRDEAARSAKAALDRETQIQDDMEKENAAVEERIRKRLQDADELDKKIEERNRRLEEERKKREEEARKREEQRKRQRDSVREPQTPREPVRTPRRAPESPREINGRRGLTLPVNGRITSRFGMRVHPVTGVYKLHDGTDYAASCGTPIRAAADGVVTERYYNRGYGNRLMIDHGRIQGVSLTTGYNHAIRYTVGVGQSVRQGQTIGYVGTTGYSTGCHLHLMVWERGRVVDPERWF